jgi:hypothetical protein
LLVVYEKKKKVVAVINNVRHETCARAPNKQTRKSNTVVHSFHIQLYFLS